MKRGKGKKKLSTVGRRTGVDVVANKKIKLQEDGFEDFNGYWTPSEGSSISGDTPEKPIHSSPKVSNVQRMSSFIKSISNSAKSNVHGSIAVDELNSESLVNSNVTERDNLVLRNSIVGEKPTPHNINPGENSPAHKKFSKNRKRCAKGWRTEADMFKGKNIKVANGVENYEDYWTDSHSEATTLNQDKTVRFSKSAATSTNEANENISGPVSSTPKTKSLLLAEETEIQTNSKHNTIAFQSPAVSSTMTTPSKSRSSRRYNSLQRNLEDQCIAAESPKNKSSVSLRKRAQDKSPVSLEKSSPKGNKSVSFKEGSLMGNKFPISLEKRSPMGNKSHISLEKGSPRGNKSPISLEKRSPKAKSPVAMEKASPKSKSPVSLEKRSPKGQLQVSVNLLPILNKAATSLRSSPKKSTNCVMFENTMKDCFEVLPKSPPEIANNTPISVPLDDTQNSDSDNESAENINDEFNSPASSQNTKSSSSPPNLDQTSSNNSLKPTQSEKANLKDNTETFKESSNSISEPKSMEITQECLLNSDGIPSTLEQDCSNKLVKNSKPKNKKSFQTNTKSKRSKTVEFPQSRNHNQSLVENVSTNSSSNAENNNLNVQQNAVIPRESNSIKSKAKNRKKAKTVSTKKATEASDEDLNIFSEVPICRRSTRSKVAPLELWRNERRILNYKNGEIKYEKGNSNVIAERLQSKLSKKNKGKSVKSAKAKLPDNSVNLKLIQNTIDKIPVNNPNTGEEEYVYLYRTYNSLLWSHPPSQDPNNPSYLITKCVAGELISFGYIDINVKKKKEKQYSPTYNMTFHVIKGRVQVTVNKTKIKLKELDTITIPYSNTYSIHNIGNVNAVLSFCTYKAPIFDFQSATC